MKPLLPLLLVLTLAACGDTPADAAPATTAAPAPAPASEPAPAAETPAPAEATAAPATPDGSETSSEAGTETPATDAPAATEPAAPEAVAETPAPAAPVAPPMDPANAPRPGIDYEVLSEPQPTFAQGGIEVAEVFAYTCIHCANLQPQINTWKPKLAGDVRFIYVPGVFGGISDNFARGYYAAEALGLLDKTHDALFRAVLIERSFTSASPEEIADWYAKAGGADRDAFLSTMQSFAVTAKLNRARQFALRGGVQSTPTMIVNGKYRAVATGDRGFDGLLATVDWLVAKERAGEAP